jgi:hypothetical protein
MATIFSVRTGARPRRRSNGKQGRRNGAEPIQMRERRHGYFPKLFVWRGKRYHVSAVERCWTVSRRSRDNRVERHCFRVRCPEGTFEVYQDVRYNTWHMQRQVA